MLKSRTLTITALACTAAVSLGLVLQPERPTRQSSPIIHKKMERMAEAQDLLIVAIEAEDAKAALRQLELLQENVIDAKSQTPASVKSLPADERDAQKSEFRKHLVGVLQTLCEIEVLIIDGDLAAAREILSGKLNEQAGAGHDAFDSGD